MISEEFSDDFMNFWLKFGGHILSPDRRASFDELKYEFSAHESFFGGIFVIYRIFNPLSLIRIAGLYIN